MHCYLPLFVCYMCVCRCVLKCVKAQLVKLGHPSVRECGGGRESGEEGSIEMDSCVTPLHVNMRTYSMC